ncbi:inter-alpha-trypsin inhibitor heavy chain H3-like, partial [Astyanax mexicanus]
RIRNISVIKVCMLLFSSPQENVEISSFHINSTVTSRYAITVITSRVKNQHTDSKEIHFEEKEAAQQQYSDAVARGESAGVVRYNLKTKSFRMTVAALSKVTFELTYEELLQRRHGKYDLLINAQPMQPVADFKPPAKLITILHLTTNGLDQQTTCSSCTENGLNGDLIITYDEIRADPVPYGLLWVINSVTVYIRPGVHWIIFWETSIVGTTLG